jgi:hypothetical protein
MGVVNDSRDAFTATYLLRRLNSKYFLKTKKIYRYLIIISIIIFFLKNKFYINIFSALFPMQYVRGVHE